MSNILLTGSAYIMQFNSPRNSRHNLIKSRAINKLTRYWRPFEGLAIWRPIQESYQLIHSFNGIPYTRKPFIVTTESFLPRTVGRGGDFLKKIFRERLRLQNCRKIITMSNYSILKLSRQNDDWVSLPEILDKVEVIHPNVPVRATHGKKYLHGEIFHVIFVGGHFARKGGIVALRLAKKAQQMNLPVQVHIVSTLELGAHVYTDFNDAARYEEDLKLLTLENVVFHGKIKNKEVLELLEKCHLQVLATLDDTYGFSLIEGFATATPAITTNVCALPEFVHHGKNGYMLELELNKYRNWVHRYLDEYRDWIYESRKGTDEYWDILNFTYEKLADQAIQLIAGLIENTEEYEKISHGALTQAINFHEAEKVNHLLDNLYLEILGQVS